MILMFHKPYGVLSQFTQEEVSHRTLAEFKFPKNVYPVGRLDWDSEGLLLLSDEKELNNLLLHPHHEHPKTYHAQVEGEATEEAISKLRKGVVIQGYKTKPCEARLLSDPHYPVRSVPIRFRLSVPTSWMELTLTEGKNRQVRRMTATAGFPTLRLVRAAHGGLKLGDLVSGYWVELDASQRELLIKR